MNDPIKKQVSSITQILTDRGIFNFILFNISANEWN